MRGQRRVGHGLMREQRGVGHEGAERSGLGGGREEWVVRGKRGVGHGGEERSGS